MRADGGRNEQKSEAVVSLQLSNTPWFADPDSYSSRLACAAQEPCLTSNSQHRCNRGTRSSCYVLSSAACFIILPAMNGSHPWRAEGSGVPWLSHWGFIDGAGLSSDHLCAQILDDETFPTRTYENVRLIASMQYHCYWLVRIVDTFSTVKRMWTLLKRRLRSCQWSIYPRRQHGIHWS